MAICNVPESSLVRESDLVLMTRAGPEIGVASTKAFTTQLTALALLVLELAPRQFAQALVHLRPQGRIEVLPVAVCRRDRSGIAHGSSVDRRMLTHAAAGANALPARGRPRRYSTVTDLARLRGWSTSVPRSTAT